MRMSCASGESIWLRINNARSFTSSLLSPAKTFAAIGNALSGNILVYCGQPEKAIERVKNAIRYAPVYASWWVEILAAAYRDSGQYVLSISAAKEAARLRQNGTSAYAILSSALAAGGWLDMAKEVVCKIQELDPGFCLSVYAKQLPYQDPRVLDAIVGDLRKAGLPE